MSTLLVPLDFSDCAPRLLGEATALARALQAELLLLHACEPPKHLPLDAKIQPPGVARPVAVRDWLMDSARGEMAGFEAVASAGGVPTRTRIEVGRIADTVLAVAAEEGVRMIVMGTHGRTGVARMTLGSVAEEVIRHAEVPVVTVRTLHQPHCEAPNCAVCDHHRGPAERALDAEEDG